VKPKPPGFTPALPGATRGANSITVNVGGGVMNSAGSAVDANFLGKLNSASTGALILTATDAGTNLDFTAGTLATLGASGAAGVGPALVLGIVVSATSSAASASTRSWPAPRCWRSGPHARAGR